MKTSFGFAIVTHIVSVGSVDGVCTASALLRVVGRDDIGLEFCQAFTVDKVDVSKWRTNERVAFVDLAVDNRDKAKTMAFVERIRAAGHEIVAVIDEHDAGDWREVLGEEAFNALLIQPKSQKLEPDFGASGAVLKAVLDPDEHTLELLEAAIAGDRMDFSTRFGGLVNQSVKSAITDDSRRVYLAKHFAFNREPDAKITGWCQEYERILANHGEIIGSRQDLGHGIVRVSALSKVVDMTTLMGELYKEAKIVVLEGEMFDKSQGKKVRQIAFGAKDQRFDLLTAIKAVVPTASGFASKVNVAPEHEATALAAVRALLQS